LAVALPADGRISRVEDDISVLVVDDDLGTRETFHWALRADGIRVRTSACGAAGITLAKAEPFDLLLVDLELPDMRGTEVIRALRAESVAPPFVLISAFLTTEATVAAMRLGALEVLDKPVSVDELPGLVRNAVRAQGQERVKGRTESLLLANLRRSAETGHRGSAADRWVVNVIKGCLAMHDPKTLRRWAKEAAVSYTTLRESCTLVGIGPHDARNLMRMLRAVLHMVAYGSALDTLLDTGDSRTFAQLIDLAGFQSAADVQSASIAEFFCRQRFVANRCPALLLLRDLVLRHVR